MGSPYWLIWPECRQNNQERNGVKTMKKVRVEEAIGMVLCHDVTKIIPGSFKGRAFRRGHVIQPEDIEELLCIGKEHIYVWEENAGEIHEDDAAVRIAKAIGDENLSFTEPVEGKSAVKATTRGLLKVNSALLAEINSIEDITIPSLPNHFTVEKEQRIAGPRIVPLVTQEANIIRVEELCRSKGPVFAVKQYQKLKVGVVVTGNEVFKGRIEDKFGPMIEQKLTFFNAEILGKELCPDDTERIRKTILTFKETGADLIVVTGGMSIDPDDLTSEAVRKTGADVVVRGIPVQPGNMFMLAYLEGIPVIGVPGAAVYYRTTVLDLVLPRIFAGERLLKDDFIRMGEGGLCMNCNTCHYPNCYYGRG